MRMFAPTGSAEESNTGLCVLAAGEKYDILVTGDLSEQAEYRLLSTHDLPHAAVLVAGHHGAATSTSEALLRAIRPEAVLISVGADNRFGHPADETLRRIEKNRRGGLPHRSVRHHHHQGVSKWQKKKPDDAAAEAERRFKADLKAGTLGSFYIICGEEAFLRSHYVELATKKLTDGPAGEFNFHRFSADDCTPQALADAIDAMPMMAERTLVRVDDVDLFKQPEGAREQYAAILSDIPDYCCVLFVYDTVEFKINSTMKKAGGRRQGARADRFVRQAVRAQFVRVDHAPLPCARQERHGRAVPVSHLPHRRADDHARR